MNKVKFTTTIDQQLLKDIKIQAVKENCSVSSLLERLIINYLYNNSDNNVVQIKDDEVG